MTYRDCGEGTNNMKRRNAMKRNNVSRMLVAAFAVAAGAYLPMEASAAEWFVSPSGNDRAFFSKGIMSCHCIREVS